MRMVRQINNGTVIDHIDAGKAPLVYALVNAQDKTAIMAMNMPSNKMGHKDFLKLEDAYLSEEDSNLIALVAPAATVSIIRNSEVAEKYRVSMPTHIRGALRCLNPDCISNSPREPLEASFTVFADPLCIKCDYCGKEFGEEIVSAL